MRRTIYPAAFLALAMAIGGCSGGETADPAAQASSSATAAPAGAEDAATPSSAAAALTGEWSQAGMRYIPVNDDMQLAIATSTVTFSEDGSFDYDGVMVMIPGSSRENVSMRVTGAGNWTLADGRLGATLTSFTMVPNDSTPAREELARNLETSFLQTERTDIAITFAADDQFTLGDGTTGIFGEEYRR